MKSEKEESNTEVNKAKGYTPTEAMKNNARRGLALRDKYNRGGLSPQEAGEQGIGSGVARARDIINGNLSLDTVKRMHSFFARHEKNYDPKKKMPDGGPTAGTVAWLTWGGSAGRAWARGILREEGILKSYQKEITKSELETEDNLPGVNLPITKAVNEELMQVTYVAMKPGVDLHGDEVDLETIRLAKESFNRQLKKARMSNLYHMVMTDSFDIIESYLAPADMVLNDNFVQKGEWLVTLAVTDTDLWELIKNDEITGVSIGAMAKVTNLADSEDQ